MTHREIGRKAWTTVVVPLLIVTIAQASASEQQSDTSQPTASSSAADTAPAATRMLAPVGPLDLRLDMSAPIEITNKQPRSLLAEWGPLISPLIAGIFGFFVALISMRVARTTTSRTIEAAQWQKVNESELSEIRNKLDNFFGPFTSLSEINLHFYNDLRSRQAAPGTFVLLEKLFDRGWIDGLPEGDKALVEQICCRNAGKIEKLLMKNLNIVDESIQPYIARTLAHFRVIRLAHDGKPGDDSTSYKKYMYPYQVNKVIDLEIYRIRTRYDLLCAELTTRHPPISPLLIPDDKDHQLPKWPDFEREPIQVTAPGA